MSELCSSRTLNSFYLQGASLWGIWAGGREILLNVLRDVHFSLTGSMCLAPLGTRDHVWLWTEDRRQHPINSQCLLLSQSKLHPDCCRATFVWEVTDNCHKTNNKSILRLPERFISWCQSSWGKQLGISSPRGYWIAVRPNLGERWETDLGLKALLPPHISCVISSVWRVSFLQRKHYFTADPLAKGRRRLLGKAVGSCLEIKLPG